MKNEITSSDHRGSGREKHEWKGGGEADTEREREKKERRRGIASVVL